MRSRALIVAGSMAAALVCGGWLLEAGFHGAGGRSPLTAFPFARGGGEGVRLFNDVAQHVARDYVDSVTPDQMYQRAVDGMLYELHDPHTAFLTPERLRRLTESTTGTYVGLGIQIDIRDAWITIIAALPGSPADRAGIQTGDRLVEIDGQATHGWTQDEATAALHGVPGTTVHVVVERPGVGARIPISLARREIHVRAVRHAMLVRPSVGYVSAAVFSDSTVRELRQTIDSLRQRGMRTLILDLRNDPGGLLTQGVAVSELFLDPGQTIVTMRGRAPGSTRRFVDDTTQRWADLGLIMLVNGGTASASEIVAGALQDHDRALIVGTPSYGKGSAQTLFHVDNGALKLTTALWYTPSGRSINRRPPRSSDDDDDAGGDAGADTTSLPDSTAAAKTVFHTDAGRLVYGGGAITPDVIVSDSTAATGDAELQRAMGTQWGLFRDAITAYALSAKAAHEVTSPEFTITAAMRDGLWQQMRARAITLDRPSYDRLTPVVDRWLTTEIDRYVFGADAAFKATMKTDPAVRVAIDAAVHAASPRDLVMRPVSTGPDATASSAAATLTRRDSAHAP
jgi:carboxyl-terminal processing protease